jgi:Domain of unknown function (DUF4387)
MTASHKLSEIAKTIRSKNAGVDKITFDVIFPDRATYDRVRESDVLSRGCLPDLRHCCGTNFRPRRVPPGIGDQVHDIPPNAKRQPR